MTANAEANRRKINPALHYAREIIPADILKIVEDARLMPYVYQNPKTKKWTCGYTYHQAIAIIGCTYQQYVTKKVTEGTIHLEGSMPLGYDEENQIRPSLLNVDDVEAVAEKYKPRDSDQIGRTYEIKGVDNEAWVKIHELLDTLAIPWTDITEKRREYSRKHRLAQKQKHADQPIPVKRPTENKAVSEMEAFARKLEDADEAAEAFEDTEETDL